ncbi:MAG: hypothetical protein Q9170_005540 [Blastenia crenularia]
MFAFWFAINDVDRSYNSPNSPNAAIMASYTRMLDKLYQTGARNFVLFNVPPVSRNPAFIAKGAAAQSRMAHDIADFNLRLGGMVRDFKNAHHDVKFFEADAHDVFNKILDKPSRYPESSPIKNTTGFSPAYGNPPNMFYHAPGVELAMHEYFWINDSHPTWTVHDALAAQIAKQMEA